MSIRDILLKNATGMSSSPLSDAIKDTSPEAKWRRLKLVFLAVYGEFCSTCFLLIPIYGALAHGYQSNWSNEFIVFTTALVTGLQVVSVTYSFSDISGAQWNSAISFALWLTGRLSNRKAACYVAIQLIASIVSILVVYGTFTHVTLDMLRAVALFPSPGADLGRLFATEFICTFILAHTAFTVALADADQQKKHTMSVQTVDDMDGLTLYTTTPQSKTGFAPFAIGFAAFSLSAFGGTYGVAMNPARMFGPAVMSGEWKYFYLYSIAELAGASFAGIFVHKLHNFRQSIQKS